MTATGKVAVVAVFAIMSLVLSLLLCGRMLIRLPPDYFTSRRRPSPTSLWAKLAVVSHHLIRFTRDCLEGAGESSFYSPSVKFAPTSTTSATAV